MWWIWNKSFCNIFCWEKKNFFSWYSHFCAGSCINGKFILSTSCCVPHLTSRPVSQILVYVGCWLVISIHYPTKYKWMFKWLLLRLGNRIRFLSLTNLLFWNLHTITDFHADWSCWLPLTSADWSKLPNCESWLKSAGPSQRLFRIYL